MKKFTAVIAFALALIISVPAAQASSRNDRHDGRPAGVVNRPGKNHKPAKPIVTRPGNRPSKPSAVHRPGQTSRPPVLLPPARPNRIPSYKWIRPVRPGSLRPGTVRFRNTILGITFGSALMNTLDRLYASNYSVDGYGNDAIYLRNVTEMNYRWTDATLFFTNGRLERSQFYESSIGFNTSRYYGVMNNIRALYGEPASTSKNGKTRTATWFGAGGEYISLEYRMLNSTGGYRYFTILTIGQ